MNKTMTIEITPAIIGWIEDCRAEIMSLEPEYQFFGPGFDEVVEAYDKVVKSKEPDVEGLLEYCQDLSGFIEEPQGISEAGQNELMKSDVKRGRR